MKTVLKRFHAYSLVAALLLSGCAATPSMPAGGILGGLVGAGAGVAIGSSIANGDVAATALLGAAIGVTAGILTAALIDQNNENARREMYLRQVRENQELIFERERAIGQLRDRLEEDSPRDLKPSGAPEHLYTGPSLGNPYR